ncbi:MAG: NAD-dependent epimerase/dehydratase family protein, partial [Paludibacteraceae bacterium]|nr:NAD-dependent epimerase/dehydratase family protein [Paludibacteraceae bacterium]
MRILVTGAKGFVGRNLCANLRNIQAGKDRRFPDLTIEAIYEYDLDSMPEQLDAWCQDCDFVFNLAGVNRPQNQEEFMQGNFGFASTLLDTLKKHGNRCPVMLSSSQQASLTGRFGNSEYGRSKKAGEDLFLDYERDFLKGQGLENLRINSQPTDNIDGTDKSFSNSQILDNKG